MPKPTEKSIRLRESYKNSDLYKYDIRNQISPLRFYKNEPRNNTDNRPVLQLIRKYKIPVYAIYGKDDLIFSSRQLSGLRNMVGASHFRILGNCSHYLYVDQHTAFLKYLFNKLK